MKMSLFKKRSDSHQLRDDTIPDSSRLLQLNLDQVRVDLQRLLDKGITSLAVVFMHSFLFVNHEEAVGDLAKNMGFTHVSLSSSVMPMARIVPRGFTVRDMRSRIK